MATLNKTLSSIAALASEKGLKFAVNVVTFGTITRYLGLEASGRLQYDIALTQILFCLSQISLEQFFVVHYQSSADHGRCIREIASARLITFMAGTVALTGYIFLSSGSGADRIILWIFSIAQLQSLSDFADASMLSRGMVSKYAFARSAGTLAGGLLKIGAVLFDGGLIGIALAFALEGLFTALAKVLFGGRSLSEPLRHGFISLRGGLRLLARGSPIVLSSILVIVYTRVDQYLVMHYKGPAENGIYMAALKTLEYCYVFPSVINTVLFPRFKASRYSIANQALTASILSVSVLMFVFVHVYPALILKLAFGSAFTGSSAILAKAAVVIPIAYFGFIRQNHFMNEGRFKNALAFELLTASIGISAMFWWIPSSGAEGGINAMILSFFLSNLVFLFVDGTTRRALADYLRSPIEFITDVRNYRVLEQKNRP